MGSFYASNPTRSAWLKRLGDCRPQASYLHRRPTGVAQPDEGEASRSGECLDVILNPWGQCAVLVT